MHKQHFSGIMQKPQKHLFFGALTFGNRTGDPCVLATQARGHTGDPCVFFMFLLCIGVPAKPSPTRAACRAAARQLPRSSQAAARAAAGQRPGKITQANVLSWQPWPGLVELGWPSCDQTRLAGLGRRPARALAGCLTQKTHIIQMLAVSATSK